MVTRRTTLLIDADLIDRLERHAERGRTTKTAVVASALEAWLASHESVPELGFVGIGESEHGRLSLDGRRITRREAGRRPSR